MALMSLDAIFPKPRTTVAAPDARVYPYLLRDRVPTHVNEVWSSDITYVPMMHGFMYLTAVIDWFSRYVRALTWMASTPARPRARMKLRRSIHPRDLRPFALRDLARLYQWWIAAASRVRQLDRNRRHREPPLFMPF